MRPALLTVFGTLVALAAPGLATAGPGLVVGAVEDDVRASTLVEAEARMTSFRLSGFRAVRITTLWTPGLTKPSDDELRTLEYVSAAAARNGVRLYVTVMHPGSRTTPLTDAARSDFAAFTAAIVRNAPSIEHVIIGNEPNLNRFWLPQFGLDGSSAAPADYLALLARTYDAIKAVSDDVTVYGGAVSPRGTDRPDGLRPTHSPTTFIQGLGVAYRTSGRSRPAMDALAIHVYGDNSSVAPTVAHPLNTSIGVADYDKLVRLLGEAFDGTGQPGSTLPILYGEYGTETQIPESKAGLYTGTEPTTTRPVTEEIQAGYYQQALALSFCQPNVVGMLLFLSRDERARAAWQSGVHYVDGTPKTSRARVTRALDRTTGGSITKCPGLALPVGTSYVRFGTRSAAKRGAFRVSFTCTLDCRYWVRLENAVTHATKLASKGSAQIGELVQATLGSRRLPPGRYRYTLRLVHPVNPAAPTVRAGPGFALP
jgi:phage tail protein X